MNDTKNLLKEIDLQCAELLTAHFNPLKLALSNDDAFPDIFNKIDRSLIAVINATFEGFSSSVFQYNAICSANEECLKDMGKISGNILAIKKTLVVDLNLLEKLRFEMVVRQNVLFILQRIENVQRTLSDGATDTSRANQGTIPFDSVRYENISSNMQDKPFSNLMNLSHADQSTIPFDSVRPGIVHPNTKTSFSGGLTDLSHINQDTLKKAFCLVRAKDMCSMIGSLSYMKDILVLIQEERNKLLNVICADICDHIITDSVMNSGTFKAVSVLQGYEKVVEYFEDVISVNLTNNVERVVYEAVSQSISSYNQDTDSEHNDPTDQDIGIYDSIFTMNDAVNFGADIGRGAKLPNLVMNPLNSSKMSFDSAEHPLIPQDIGSSTDLNAVVTLWKSLVKADTFTSADRLIAKNISDFFNSILNNYEIIHKQLSQCDRTSMFIERKVEPRILESKNLFSEVSVRCLKRILDKNNHRKSHSHNLLFSNSNESFGLFSNSNESVGLFGNSHENMRFSLSNINENVNLDLVLGDLSLDLHCIKKSFSEPDGCPNSLHQGSNNSDNFSGYNLPSLNFDTLYLLYLTLPVQLQPHFYKFIENKFHHEKHPASLKAIASLNLDSNILPNGRSRVLPKVLNILQKLNTFKEIKDTVNLSNALLQKMVDVFEEFVRLEFSDDNFNRLILNRKDSGTSAVNLTLRCSEDYTTPCENDSSENRSAFYERVSETFDEVYSPRNNESNLSVQILSNNPTCKSNMGNSGNFQVSNTQLNRLDPNSTNQSNASPQRSTQYFDVPDSKINTYNGSKTAERSADNHNFSAYDSIKFSTNPSNDDEKTIHSKIPSLKAAYLPNLIPKRHKRYALNHTFDETSPIYLEYISSYSKNQININKAPKYDILSAKFKTMYVITSIMEFEYSQSANYKSLDSKIDELKNILDKTYICLNITVLSNILQSFHTVICGKRRSERHKSFKELMSSFSGIQKSGLYEIVNIQTVCLSLVKVLEEEENEMFVSNIDDLCDLLRDLYAIHMIIVSIRGSEALGDKIRYFEDVLKDRCDTTAKIGLRKRLLLSQ